MNTEITLLGRLAVSRDGQPLALPQSRKTRALLAYLIVTGRAHRRERLCDVFWDIPDDPRGALRWSLSKLRKIVDAPDTTRIKADRTNVVFDPTGVSIDLNIVRNTLADGGEAVSTETLAALAATFDGEFLEGLDLPDCPEFQSWCVAEREDARILHVRILRALIDRHEADPQAALSYARTLTELDPHDGAAAATLQRLMTETGRRSGTEPRRRSETSSTDRRASDGEEAQAPAGVPHPPPDPTGTPPRAASQAEASIAVLPFANRSADRRLEYMAEGLTEDIITQLARIPGFLLISGSSTFAFRDGPVDVRDVGRDLGVRYVVEGSLRPIGDSLRVSVRLTEAESGKHLWAEQFDRAANDLPEIQDMTTTGILARLAPELVRAELEQIKRRVPSDLDAWSHYKEAMGRITLGGWQDENFAVTLDLLRKAIALDPEFALAHAFYALLLAVGRLSGLLHADQENHDESLVAAETALALDGQNSSVLGFAGCALADLGYAERGMPILEHAVAIDPSNAQAWVGLGTALVMTGRVEDGVEKLRHGIRVSPLDGRLAFWESVLASGLFRLGQYEEALDQAREACSRDVSVAFPRLTLAVVAAAAGQTLEAEAALEDAHRIQPGLTPATILRIVGRKGFRQLQKAGLLD